MGNSNEKFVNAKETIKSKFKRKEYSKTNIDRILISLNQKHLDVLHGIICLNIGSNIKTTNIIKIIVSYLPKICKTSNNYIVCLRNYPNIGDLLTKKTKRQRANYIDIAVLGQKNAGKTSLMGFTQNIGDNGVIPKSKFMNIGVTFNELEYKIWLHVLLSDNKREFDKYHIFVIVFDILDETSYNFVNEWINYLNKKSIKHKHVPWILVGNKCELINKMDTASINQYYNLIYNVIKHYNVPYIECSGKYGYNVELLYQIIVKERLFYMNFHDLKWTYQLGKKR